MLAYKIPSIPETTKEIKRPEADGRITDMVSFNVYRHPQRGNLKAIQQGYCYPIVVWNVLLFPLGWIYPFIRGATRFGWQLLALSIVALVLMSVLPGLLTSATALLWLGFIVSLGASANKRIEASLKQRGFNLLRNDVVASASDAAIEAVIDDDAPNMAASLESERVNRRRYRPQLTTRGLLIAAGILVAIFIAVLVLVAGSANDLGLKLQVDPVGQLWIWNTGSGPVNILDLTINDRPECFTLGMGNQIPQTLRVGDHGLWWSGCGIVRVNVRTDRGSETYTFGN